MVQVMPQESYVVVVVVDDDKRPGKASQEDYGQAPPLEMSAREHDTHTQSWRQWWSAWIGLVVVGSLLCPLMAMQILESVDVEAAIGLARVVLFLAAYVGTWAVLARVYRWINSA